MPLAYTYTDPYLAPLVTEDRETRAAAMVAEVAAFPAEHLARLVPLRAYMLVCIESVQHNDDTFAVKLAAYRKEYDYAMTLAKAETPNSAGNSLTSFSVEIDRG